MNTVDTAGKVTGDSKETYVSLSSCAGIECYSFKLDGFECIATNE